MAIGESLTFGTSLSGYVLPEPPYSRVKYELASVLFSLFAQVAARPPTFLFFVNNIKGFMTDNTFSGFLDKQLRRSAGFEGSPIRFIWRASKNAPRHNKRGWSRLPSPAPFQEIVEQ